MTKPQVWMSCLKNMVLSLTTAKTPDTACSRNVQSFERVKPWNYSKNVSNAGEIP